MADGGGGSDLFLDIPDIMKQDSRPRQPIQSSRPNGWTEWAEIFLTLMCSLGMHRLNKIQVFFQIFFFYKYLVIYSEQFN